MDAQISQQLVQSYLSGGSLWPQIRGGINIFLLYRLVYLINTKNCSAVSLLSVAVSKQEMESVSRTMDALHKQYGISIHQNPDVLEEWYILTAFLINALAFYKSNPIDTYIKNLKQTTASLNLHVAAQELEFLVNRCSSGFTEAIERVRDKLLQMKDISLAFRLSIAQENADKYIVLPNGKNVSDQFSQDKNKLKTSDYLLRYVRQQIYIVSRPFENLLTLGFS